MVIDKQGSKVFIGREWYLSILYKAFQSVHETKKSKVVLVNGDFGIGKTTLVEKFLSLLSQTSNEIIIGQAKCTADSKFSGYSPFNELLQNISLNNPHYFSKSNILKRMMFKLAPAWVDVFTSGAASMLIDAIEKSTEFGNELRSRKYNQDNIIYQFANLLDNISKKNTVCIFLDNIQAADDSSLVLLSNLPKIVKDKPILIVATHDGRVNDVEKNLSFNTCLVGLRRLNAEEYQVSEGINTRIYFEQRYPQNNFASSLIEQIEYISEGLPLFLDEICTYWENIGMISPDPNNTWTIKNSIDLEKIITQIPLSISAIVQYRLSMMGRNTRRAVECAAIEGAKFSAQIVMNSLSHNEDEIFEILSQLQDDFLLIKQDMKIEDDSIKLDLYKFLRIYYQEYIYNQVDDGKKRNLHKKIGNELEKIYGPKINLIASKLIDHFTNCGEYEKAARYCVIAAKHEQQKYGLLESEKICSEGLMISEKIKDITLREKINFDLLRISAKSHYIRGNAEQAYYQYIEIHKILPNITIPLEEHLEFLLDLNDACEGLNNITEAISYVNEAERIIKENNYSGPYTMQFSVYKSWEYIRGGKNELAVEILHEVLKQTKDKSEFDWISSMAYNALGEASSNLGDRNSTNYLKKAVEYAEKIGDLKLKVVSELNLADDLLYYNELAEAISFNRDAQKLSRRIGDRDGEAYSIANSGRIEMLKNNPQKAIPLLEKSIVISNEIGSNWNNSFVFSDLANSFSMVENFDKAFEKISQAELFLEDDPFRSAYVLRHKGKIFYRAGMKNQGKETLVEALRIVEEIGDQQFSEEIKRDLEAFNL